MKRARTNNKHIVNFRQWSRKGYAVFASLGQNVRIAVLKLAVSESLSCKDHKANAIDGNVVGHATAWDDDEASVETDSFFIEFTSAFMLPIATISLAKAACEPAQNISKLFFKSPVGTYRQGFSFCHT